jgi:hypothetical protein
MPVLRAFGLALFVVGSLEARDGDTHEQSKKLVGTRVGTNRRKSRMETPSYNAIVVRQAIKDDLADSGLRVRVVIRKKLAAD